MKRWLTILTGATLLFAAAGTASAAGSGSGKAAPASQTQKPDIQVIVNGSAVQTSVPPANRNNTIYVEFRPLFEKLGYQLEYDGKTKTIHAKSASHEISLTYGADVAFVDGRTVPAGDVMANVNGHTIVGVRFVATLSGMDVVWQASDRTVRITENRPTEEQQKAIFDVFNKLLLLEAAQDPRGAFALFAADSLIKPQSEQAIENEMKKRKTRTEILDKTIQSFNGKEAVVLTKEHTVGVSGDYYFNNVSDNKYVLHPGANGEWLIYSIQTMNIAVDDPDGLLDQGVTVPDADKDAIGELLKAQNDAYNKEDKEAFRATIDPSYDLEDSLKLLDNLFSQYDFSYTIERSAIVSYDTDHAVVVQRKRIASASGGGSRIIQGNELVKKDGKWLFAGTEYLLKQETLQ